MESYLEKLPKPFVERMKKILDDPKFFKYAIQPLKKTIRVNKLKISRKELVERLEKKGLVLKELEFYKDGFVVENNETALGNLLEHYLGYFYIQESASMLPPLFMELKEGELVLDMAAAPGSKTTEISMIMKNSGFIVANEPYVQRIKALSDNISRLGCINVGITKKSGTYFERFPSRFDKVLLDAPCSSEGTMRKDPLAIKTWSIKKILKLSKLQKRLIVSAFKTLKPGGILVYSTCTYAPEENEEVVDFLLKNFENAKIEKIELDGLKTRKGIRYFNGKEYSKEVEKAIRLFPQDNDTEGFFIAKIRKVF